MPTRADIPTAVANLPVALASTGDRDGRVRAVRDRDGERAAVDGDGSTSAACGEGQRGCRDNEMISGRAGTVISLLMAYPRRPSPASAESEMAAASAAGRDRNLVTRLGGLDRRLRRFCLKAALDHDGADSPAHRFTLPERVCTVHHGCPSPKVR